ncbi:MAG TPA: hypothetical protein VN370_05905 [Desulfitobacteriaceae bacterium]|nr:hypothetical protein [Desulfitobacteriaceae bacterium]
MKIENSALDMKSTRTYENKQENRTRLHFWDQNSNIELSSEQDELNISALAQKLYQKTARPASQNSLEDAMEGTYLLSDAETAEASGVKEGIWPELSDKDKMKLFLIKMMIKTLNHKKVIDIENNSLDSCPAWEGSRMTKLFKCYERIYSQQLQQPQQAQTQQLGWGVEITYHELRQETEQTSFSTEGIIKTQDGQSIAVSMSLQMRRSTTIEVTLSYKAGDAVKDPLVVNYSGGTADLTSEKYDFDLDSNGVTEKISFVRSGGGFLALDKNSDGVINDGRELFGAATGQGFKELAEYDSDDNNWIDENDLIFNNLRIWTKDQNGKDHLYDLGSLGIGAICLDNIDTPFSLLNQDNETDGYVRTTGIFLKENGQAGTVQQLDLVV